jgi:glycerophosphoryl diester phosphodiesterase
MSKASTWPYPKWIAHRGAGKRAPENTLAAFKLGASFGYRMFECDVQVSADGVPFLLHDDTLDRTTTGHGLACAQTWAELRKLDAGSWHSPQYAGEPIPCLSEIAEFCRQHQRLLNIEIKPSPGEEERCGRLIAQAVEREWTGQGRDGSWPLLSSFKPEALQAARLTAGHLPRALLLEKMQRDSVGLAHALGCGAVILEQSQWEQAHVCAVTVQGMHCMTYTINDVGRAQHLSQMGITGLITDTLYHQEDGR